MLPRTLLATAVAAVALTPAVASAATISYSGTTLVYTDDGNLVDDLIVGSDEPGQLKITEYAGRQLTFPADKCELLYGSDDTLGCEMPAKLQFDLRGGTDELSLGFGLPAAMPAEVLAGDGDDVLKDDYAADTGRTFDGGAGNDTIEGYKGDDTLVGGPGDDKLAGGEGADTVRGDDGNDLLEGDRYAKMGADVIDGGPGFDVMEEYSIPSQDINPPATVTQDGVANDGRPGENDNVTSVEKITSHVAGTYNGTEGDDEVWVWSNVTTGDSTINGLGGNDKLKGSEETEAIDGGAGDDDIEGGYGNDTIVGGPGKDKINGDGGSYCGLYDCKVPFGDDTIDVRDGEVDQVECGIGNDTVKADKVDQIAPSCETVEQGGATDPVPGPGPGPGTDPDAPAGGKLTVAAGKAGMKGLRFTVPCAAACKVSGTLFKGAKKVGAGRATLLAAGDAKVRVKLSRAGKKALRKGKAGKLTLKVSVTDAAGAKRSAAQKVAFKR